mgnify:FL=1|tara:strand:+ start:32 stop:478 length:447 start_codon:yes stop_codon:yes gene_type:complete
MENENTEYKDGDHNSFIEYVFKDSPKEKNSIKLELDSPQEGNNINKHIFEQLLQIFTDGMKYLYSGDDNKIDIVSLDIDSILKMKEYFESFGVELIFNMYNQTNYVLKPYIYNSPELYNKSKSVNDFYYEIPLEKNNQLLVYRISFNL